MKKEGGQNAFVFCHTLFFHARNSLFSSTDSFVEALDQSIDIDAMSHSALLDVLEMRSSAAKAAHASVDEYINRVGIFLNNFEDAHIFGDCHMV